MIWNDAYIFIHFISIYLFILKITAKVLDFIQTTWILDPSMFALDLINNNLDFHLILALAKNSLGISTLNALLSVQFNVVN